VHRFYETILKGGCMVRDNTLRDIMAATLPFVMARRKTTGGFGATPKLPATIEDTYHALNILRLAKDYDAVAENTLEPSADKNLRSYLTACRQTMPAGTRTIFQMLWCYKTARLELDQVKIEETATTRMLNYDSLAEWYYCARILVEILGKPTPLDIRRKDVDILKHVRRTINEVWMHIYLSWAFGAALPVPKAELIAWLQADQNGDGGFGFYPITTSFIENCHACLRSLTFLGTHPLYQDKAFQFLFRCQNATGGFGRNSRAAAFLDATWHALASLVLVNGTGMEHVRPNVSK